MKDENHEESMIEIHNAKKTFTMGDEEIKAINDIDFVVKKGEFVSIVGPSGSGKSTLMNVLGLLDILDSGEYFLDGINVNNLKDSELAALRNKKIGFIFQSFNLLAKLNAIENVEVPLMYKGLSSKKSRQVAKEYLKKVGLEGREHHLPSQLSGGQQQRVAIARALVCNPEVILADEPTGALDSKTGIEVMENLQKLNDEGQTIVLITHDINIAKKAKRVVKIADGKLYESQVL